MKYKNDHILKYSPFLFNARDEAKGKMSSGTINLLLPKYPVNKCFFYTKQHKRLQYHGQTQNLLTMFYCCHLQVSGFYSD